MDEDESMDHVSEHLIDFDINNLRGIIDSF